ncbi:unnamed protein product [Auanema sp. JU1783]|nr:unnamed protein product [Auanema sp. JU1783]
MSVPFSISSSSYGSSSSGSSDCKSGKVLHLKGQPLLIEQLIGKGTFAEVYTARHEASRKLFALKFLPQDSDFDRRIMESEVEIVRLVTQNVAYRKHFPRIFCITSWNQYRCIVMEKMDIDLFSFLNANDGRPIDLHHIRNIGKQVLSATSYLHSLGIIHTDIKPENIVIANALKSPYDVRLIDLGCAIMSSASPSLTGRQIQSMFYRSPEVLLGSPFNEAIDIWSIGCVLAELYMGFPLYPGQSQRQMIKLITSTQGFPPQLEQSMYWTKYISVVKRQTELGKTFRAYRLKTEQEYLTNGGSMSDLRFERLPHFYKLSEICGFGLNYCLKGGIRDSDMEFASFLDRLLNLSSNKRYTAREALQDSFLTQHKSDRTIMDGTSDTRTFKKAVRKSKSLVIL